MKLQPLDIKRQTFTRGFRGYEPAEVDAFLKQVADQQASLLDDLRQAEDRVREADAKLKHYERVEEALQEALETARETGRRAEVAAERESRAVLERAEARAEEIVRDAERERYTLRQDVRSLAARQSEVAARLRGFLLSELEILAQFQGDDTVGFLRLQPAAPGATLPTGLLEAPASPDALLGGTADLPPEPDAPAAPPVSDEASVGENLPDEPLLEEAPVDEAPVEEVPDDRSFADAMAEAEPSPLGDETEDSWNASAMDEDDAYVPTLGEADVMPAEADEDASTPAPSWGHVPAPPELPAEATEPLAEVPMPEWGSAAEPPPPAWQPPPWSGAPATPAPPSSVEPVPESPPAEPPAWDLRSLVTGADAAPGGPNVAGSEAERERIRRILDDLD